MSRVEPFDDAPVSETPRLSARSSAGTNVRVVCRFRPQNSREKEEGGHPIVEIDEPSEQGHTLHILGESEGRHKFTFDRVFGTETTQVQVYEHAAKPIVESVLDGYNGTVFAYGQTGSGKTFTMEGPSIEDPQVMGIIPRMVTHVFNMIMGASANVEFTVSVSLVEIYLERIRDLLDENKDNLSVHEDKIKGVYIEDATQEYVSSPEDVYAVMHFGASLRAVASTNMNNQSSRSHSIFMMEIKQRDTKTEGVKVGKLFLVDLAGSEKVRKTNAQGDRLEEAKNINKSLSALGNVINALTDSRSSHVPYRDSKLTRILQQSLGGNAMTCLVLAASPSSWNEAETISTLRFGARAKMIKNNARVNQEFTAAQLKIMLNNAESEIARLKGLMASGGLAGLVGEQSEEDRCSFIQMQDALLDQLREKTDEATAAKEEAGDLRQEITQLTLAHDDEVQGLKDQIEELREQVATKQSQVDALEDQVRRQQDELVDKEKMIEMLAAPQFDEEAEPQGKDAKIAQLEALVELQRGELRELEKLHSGIDGAKNTSLTDLLAAKELENEKFRGRIKEQEARSARLLTMIRSHQERERQFKTIVKQLTDAHNDNSEKFKKSMQESLDKHAKALREVKNERDTAKQANRALQVEIEELRKAHIKLTMDIKDRCDRLVELEMELDREKDQHESMLEQGGVKDPKSLKRTVDFLQRNLEQYSNVCQQLLVDNHQLSHRFSTLEQRCSSLQVAADRFERLRAVIVATEALKQAVIGKGISHEELESLQDQLDALPADAPPMDDQKRRAVVPSSNKLFAVPSAHTPMIRSGGAGGEGGAGGGGGSGLSLNMGALHLRDRPRIAKPIRGGAVREPKPVLSARSIPIKARNTPLAPLAPAVEAKVAKKDNE